MLSHDLNVKDFKLPVDGKSGTGGLWMTYVVPPVLLNQGYSPPCKFGYTIYIMLTNGYTSPLILACLIQDFIPAVYLSVIATLY